MLRQLHRVLLQYSTKDERHRGEWKSLPNHASAFDADGRELGIVFEASSPFDAPAHMDILLDWHRRAEVDTGLHALLRIGIFTVVFLAVHPFQDGNGRLSRILITLLLLRAGYGHVPYSSLESIIEPNKEAYCLALRRTQTTWREDPPTGMGGCCSSSAASASRSPDSSNASMPIVRNYLRSPEIWWHCLRLTRP